MVLWTSQCERYLHTVKFSECAHAAKRDPIKRSNHAGAVLVKVLVQTRRRHGGDNLSSLIVAHSNQIFYSRTPAKLYTKWWKTLSFFMCSLNHPFPETRYRDCQNYGIHPDTGKLPVRNSSVATLPPDANFLHWNAKKQTKPVPPSRPRWHRIFIEPNRLLNLKCNFMLHEDEHLLW